MVEIIRNKFRFVNDIDFFGKEPELYYKGKEKRVSWIGRIFTFIFFALYVIIFVYKFIKMIQKEEGTFLETISNNGEIPSIQLTNKNFYGGFALCDPPLIDETIYYPKLEFRRGERISGEWVWESKEIELERCQLSKFDRRYWDLFRDKPINDLYCIKDLNETLEGYSHREKYSYFYLTLHACNVTTKDGRECKPPFYIEKYLMKNIFQFFIQDIDLFPHDYYNPSRISQKIITGPVFKNLLQKIYTYMQIIDVQTDKDSLGLSAFSNYNSEKLLKYEESWIISAPNENETYENGFPFCEITIQLSQRVITQRRSFIKLTEVFGEVGGTMNVIYIIFNFFVSYLANLLYKTALVNNLFSFDIEKKIIKLKENKHDILNSKEKNANDVNADIKNIKDNSTIPIENNSPEDLTNKNKEPEININNIIKNENDNANQKTKKVIKRKKRKIRTTIVINKLRTSGNDNDIMRSPNPFDINFKKEDSGKDSVNEFNSKVNLNRPNNFVITKSIINKIEMKKFQVFLCFLCIRKKKKVENYLLDKGIKLISNKLDITNIFKKIYICEKIKDCYNKDGELDIINMPDEWNQKIQEYKDKAL